MRLTWLTSVTAGEGLRIRKVSPEEGRGHSLDESVFLSRNCSANIPFGSMLAVSKCQLRLALITDQRRYQRCFSVPAPTIRFRRSFPLASQDFPAESAVEVVGRFLLWEV